MLFPGHKLVLATLHLKLTYSAAQVKMQFYRVIFDFSR